MSNKEIDFKCLLCGHISPQIDSFFLDSDNTLNIKMHCKCQNNQITTPVSTLITSLLNNSSNEANCFFHPGSPSVMYCIACAQFLCSNCLRDHQLIMNPNEHRVVQSQREAPVTCQRHPNEANVFHCYDCSMQCCPKCNVNMHKGHSVLNLLAYWNRINNRHHIDINYENDNLIKQKVALDQYKEKVNGIMSQLELIKDMIDNQHLIINQNQTLVKFIQVIQHQFNNAKSSNDYLSMINYEHLHLSPLAQMFNDTKISNSLQTIQTQSDNIKSELSSFANMHNYYVTAYSNLFQANIVSMKPNKKFIFIKKKYITKCEKIFQARNCPIFGMVELNNGTIASYANQDYITIWNITIGSIVNTLRGHEGNVISMHLLRDGRLISGDSNDHIIIWNIENTNVSEQIIGNALSYTQMNNDCVLITTKSGYIEYYAINNGLKKLFSITGHDMPITCSVALVNDLFATGSQDKTIKIWNVIKKQMIKALIGHMEAVSCLVKLDNERMASSSNDKTIRVWDYVRYCCIIAFPAHNEAVRQLCCLPNDQFVSCSVEPPIKIWNKQNYQLECEIKNSHFNTRSIVYTRQGELIVATSEKTIQVWR